MGAFRTFDMTGPTVKVAGASTAPSGVQVLSVGAPKAEQYRIHNAGTVTAFIAYGISAGTAQSNAVIPTGSGASSKSSFPLPAGWVEVITAPLDCYWSAITAAGTADIYITPGMGL